MNIGRYENSTLKEAKLFPENWTKETNQLLNKLYEKRAQDDDCFFEIYAYLFDKELVIITSYQSQNDLSKFPITLYISHDHLEDSKKTDACLESSRDLIAMIFDDIFSTEYWRDFNNIWTQNKLESFDFFYKTTRENFSLSLQAEALLNQ